MWCGGVVFAYLETRWQALLLVVLWWYHLFSTVEACLSLEDFCSGRSSMSSAASAARLDPSTPLQCLESVVVLCLGLERRRPAAKFLLS